MAQAFSAVQPRHQHQSKATGSHPPLAALAGSPSTAAASNCVDPDVVRQLPEVVRHVLHGCVSTGHGTVERGAHLTIYVTSADPAGSNTFSSFDQLKLKFKIYSIQHDGLVECHQR